MAHPIVRRSSQDLIEAIENADVAKVRDLLEAGINVHARDDTEEGFAAVHYAVFEDNQEILKLLLEHGAYADHTNHCGIYPLDIAFDHGYVDCIKTLVEYQAQVNLRICERLPVGDSYDEVRKLFYNHVNMNERDKLGCNILLKAIQYEDIGGIQILTSRGANVNIRRLEDGRTPLHLAAKHGNVDCIKLLLKHGARPDLKDEFGHTPLHVLIHAPISRAVKVQIALLLLETGDAVNISCNMDLVALQHAVTIEGTAIVQKVIVENIAKMQHNGEHVNDANCELISNSDQLSSFHEKCIKELKNIEDDTITGKVKLREFLYSNEKLLTLYTQNIEVKRAFNGHQYRRQYPIYYKSLRRNFTIALKKRKLLDTAAMELHSVIPQIHFNSIATEKILGYLSEKDLTNLISAGLSKNNCKP